MAVQHRVGPLSHTLYCQTAVGVFPACPKSFMQNEAHLHQLVCTLQVRASWIEGQLVGEAPGRYSRMVADLSHSGDEANNIINSVSVVIFMQLKMRQFLAAS